MKSKLLLIIFFVNLFSLNGSFAASDSASSKPSVSKKDLDDFVASISKDEKNKNLLQALLQSQLISNLDQPQTGTQGQEGGFKKRYLLSLLGLLGFSGINFGFFYKLFTGMNDRKTKIQELQTVQQQQTEALQEHAKILEELKALCKQEPANVEKRLIDEIGKVETNSAQEITERLTKISNDMNDMKESDSKLKQQLSDLEKALKDGENKSQEKLTAIDTKINSVQQEAKQAVQEAKQIAKDDKENQAALEKTVKDALIESAKTNADLRRALSKDAQENYDKLVEKFKEHVKMVDSDIERKVKECVQREEDKKGFWQDFFSLKDFGGISGFIDVIADGTKAVTSISGFLESLSTLSKVVSGEDSSSEKGAQEDEQNRKRIESLFSGLKRTSELPVITV
jgi:hypothetical protein